MTKHIDYEVEAKLRTWWLNNTGGAAKDSLTVRDYFAAQAMAKMKWEAGLDVENAADAYAIADAMMQARVLDKQGEL